MKKVINFIKKYRVSITACVLMAMLGVGVYFATGQSQTSIGDNIHAIGNLTTDGNLGVGIASPTEKLEVVGNADISGDLTVDGSAELKGGISCGNDFTDARDSNTYSTVRIGGQCWMAENLAYLPSVVGGATGGQHTKYYYVYDYEGTSVSSAKATTNYQTYGVLYNWTAAQSACPAGWRLPTDAELHALDVHLTTGSCDASRSAWDCTPAGSAMKTVAWGGDNSSGFTALPAGYRVVSSPHFRYLGTKAHFWSSSQSAATTAWFRSLSEDYSTVARYAVDKGHGFPVRCLRDF